MITKEKRAHRTLFLRDNGNFAHDGNSASYKHAEFPRSWTDLFHEHQQPQQTRAADHDHGTLVLTGTLGRHGSQKFP
jgi:hypothetical protein